MTSDEFTAIRKKIDKTQKELGELLGVSMKAIHSYEQGWRAIPPHVERQVYFLLSRKRSVMDSGKACWVIKKCPPERKKQCPAWEFQAGNFCWFINGTICECKAEKNWKDKMKLCRNCEVLKSLLED
ncbi:MAG: transcriptional regulator [Proteobacteria bacterium]|nr:transcriptional regulator [Pseudomonadota bacterium]MBU1717121.1 transcriptional regulator [Pseudomonadota bacterium]